MKNILILCSVAAAVLLSAQAAKADLMWADSVTDYSSKIQNYGSIIMDSTTEFWVMGAPDADVDGNGYVWDTADLDYVAGWKAGDPNEYFIVHFSTALADIAGVDLNIHMYGGPKAGANVLASTDGVAYTQIGTLGGGTPGYLRNEAFDFDGNFNSGVQFIKVQRTVINNGSGMFFDAFSGTPVPEPSTVVLLLTAAGFLAVCRRKRVLEKSEPFSG